MNNTITPKQVEALCSEIDGIFSDAKNKIESKMIAYNSLVSKNWADEDAVEFTRKISNSMNSVINSLAENSNNIKFGIVDFANYYAKIGNKPMMNSSRTVFHSAINPSIVKPSFDDGETYGFKGDNSSEQIAEQLETLIKDCNGICNNLTECFQSVNAFGNPEIKAIINRVGNQVSKSFMTTIQDIRNTANDKIYHVSSDYNKVTEAASELINSSFIEGHGGIFR